MEPNLITKAMALNNLAVAFWFNKQFYFNNTNNNSNNSNNNSNNSNDASHL